MVEGASEAQDGVDEASRSKLEKSAKEESSQSKLTQNVLNSDTCYKSTISGDRLSRIEEIKLEIELLDKRKQFDIELRREEIRLQEEVKQNSFKRQTQLIRHVSVNVIGIFFIGAGAFFTPTENMLGPFMLSLGAGAVGINAREAAFAVKSLSDSDSKSGET